MTRYSRLLGIDADERLKRTVELSPARVSGRGDRVRHHAGFLLQFPSPVRT